MVRSSNLIFSWFVSIVFLLPNVACAKTSTTDSGTNNLAALDATNTRDVFGRYVGVLRHESLKRDQIAKLDFVLSREAGNQLELMAVLTLHFGDFKSREYVAYHFDNVQYNLLTQTLVFDQPDADVTITVTNFANGQFEGEVRSNFSGNVGKLVLTQNGIASPQYPLIEPLSGEYEGNCLSYPSRLQLLTYRSMDDTARVGNPFATFRVRGEMGQDQGEKCGFFDPVGYCVWAHFDQASYNFYKSHLVLTGPRQNLVCSVVTGGLSCDQGCKFTRRSNEMAAPLAMSPLVSQSAFSSTGTTGGPALTTPVETIQGEYTGYLHHEYLDTYQPARINILTYQGSGGTPGQPKLQLSAVATLFFGNADSAEAIAYRFTTRPYPNPIADRQFVFRRPENDVDAVLQVTEFGDGVVKGVWNSILFGRVGSFELRKDGKVSIPSQAKTMSAISGLLEGTQWDVNLVVGLGKTPPNTENPFFPLTLNGWAMFREGGAKTTITTGSYDFYTGKVGFENGERGVFIGTREAAKATLKLNKFGHAITAPLIPFTPQFYRKTPFVP